MTTGPMTVVLDLGGVLIDWDPRRLFARLIDDAEQREVFLDTVCTMSWHAEQDRGRSTAVATAELVRLHPDRAELIEAFYGRWAEMFGGELPASVDVVRGLAAAGVRLLGLTNWPAELFAEARSRFPVLGLIEGIVVSGEEGVAKPDEAVYRVLLDRYGVDPRTTVYVDDNPDNVQVARQLGMTGIVFADVVTMRRDLAAVGLPVDATVDVRPAAAGDLAALTDIYNHHVTHTAATFDTEPRSLDDRSGWLAGFGAAGAHRLLVAERGGEVLGYAGTTVYRARPAYSQSVESTVYLRADAVAQGVGTLLYQQLFASLRGEDVHRVVASIALPNPASIALHRRFGFTDVGTLTEIGRKHGRWWDVHMMCRALP